MQRRKLTERRAKEAASNLIREVTSKKDRDSNNTAKKEVCSLQLLTFCCESVNVVTDLFEQVDNRKILSYIKETHFVINCSIFPSRAPPVNK